MHHWEDDWGERFFLIRFSALEFLSMSISNVSIRFSIAVILQKKYTEIKCSVVLFCTSQILAFLLKYQYLRQRYRDISVSPSLNVYYFLENKLVDYCIN